MMVLRQVGEAKELIPTINEAGEVVYPQLASLKLAPSEVSRILEQLTQEGYLEAKLYGTLLQCPKCGGSQLNPIFKCPNCGSRALLRERLLEHLVGGHIHPESMFRSKGKQVCPSCGREVKAGDYRVLGGWFVCQDCGRKHPHITPDFECLTDNHSFKIMDGNFRPIYRYVVTEQGLSALMEDRHMILEVIRELLEQHGKVVMEVYITGGSGVKHRFDFQTDMQGKQLLVDLVHASNAVDSREVLARYAKFMDINSVSGGGYIYLIVGWPRIGEEAKGLLQFYKIPHVEASTVELVREGLEETLKTLAAE